MNKKIVIKRTYEKPEISDGYRILIDKFWPRGEKKVELPYNLWVKELAPSDSLREWFHQNPDERWKDFRKKYLKELEQSSFVKDLFEKIKDQEKVTLLYSSKNVKENNAVVLKEFLDAKS